MTKPIINKRTVLVALLAMLSGCAMVGQEHCIVNGHAQGTPGYRNCQINYVKNYTHYRYCKNKGVVLNGPQMDQCIAESQEHQAKIQAVEARCELEAENKYPVNMIKTKGEEGVRYNLSSKVLRYKNDPDVYYTQDEIEGFRRSYLDKCISASGIERTGFDPFRSKSMEFDGGDLIKGLF